MWRSRPMMPCQWNVKCRKSCLFKGRIMPWHCFLSLVWRPAWATPQEMEENLSENLMQTTVVHGWPQTQLFSVLWWFVEVLGKTLKWFDWTLFYVRFAHLGEIHFRDWHTVCGFWKGSVQCSRTVHPKQISVAKSVYSICSQLKRWFMAVLALFDVSITLM